MKTNHQRNFKETRDHNGYRRKIGAGAVVMAIKGGDGLLPRTAYIGYDHHGGSGYAHAMKGAKQYVHTRTRQDEKIVIDRELREMNGNPRQSAHRSKSLPGRCKKGEQRRWREHYERSLRD